MKSRATRQFHVVKSQEQKEAEVSSFYLYKGEKNKLPDKIQEGQLN